MRACVNPHPQLAPTVSVVCEEGWMTFHFRETTLPILFSFHGFRIRISFIILAAAVRLVFALYCICTDRRLEHCSRIWIPVCCRVVCMLFQRIHSTRIVYRRHEMRLP